MIQSFMVVLEPLINLKYEDEMTWLVIVVWISYWASKLPFESHRGGLTSLPQVLGNETGADRRIFLSAIDLCQHASPRTNIG